MIVSCLKRPCKTSNTVLQDWRDAPVLEAISYGVASIEADVWLVNGTLFVSKQCMKTRTAFI